MGNLSRIQNEKMELQKISFLFDGFDDLQILFLFRFQGFYGQKCFQFLLRNIEISDGKRMILELILQGIIGNAVRMADRAVSDRRGGRFLSHLNTPYLTWVHGRSEILMSQFLIHRPVLWGKRKMERLRHRIFSMDSKGTVVRWSLYSCQMRDWKEIG
jgi:hypothetical protein